MKVLKKFVALALVLATVLSIAITAQATYSTMYVNCNAGETVRLRKSPSTSATVLVEIPRGTAVQAEVHDSSWHKVIYGEQQGYMMSSFLSTNHPDSNNNYITMYVTCTPGETVRLRKTASTSGTVLAKVPNGTAVQAKYYNNSWYQVQYNSSNGLISGYMMSDFLSMTNPNVDVEGYVKYLSRTNLSLSASGQAVTNLQYMLKAVEFDPGTIDGKFGANTRTAVENFQRSKGLTVDGIVGTNTKSALWAACGYHAPANCVVIGE